MLTIRALIVFVVFVAGLLAGARIEGNRRDARALADARVAAKQIDEKNVEIYNLGVEYEKNKRLREKRFARHDREVDAVADRPAYAAACLDPDGLRLANAAILGFVDEPSQLDATVPSTRTAERRKKKDRPAVDR